MSFPVSAGRQVGQPVYPCGCYAPDFSPGCEIDMNIDGVYFDMQQLFVLGAAVVTGVVAGVLLENYLHPQPPARPSSRSNIPSLTKHM